MIVKDSEQDAIALMKAKSDLDEIFDYANSKGVNVRYADFNGNEFSMICGEEMRKFDESKVGYKNAISWTQNKVRNHNSLNFNTKMADKDSLKKENEVYLKGYFYFKTNANSLEDAMHELEELGLNMDNANEIELRDEDGGVLETLDDKKIER